LLSVPIVLAITCQVVPTPTFGLERLHLFGVVRPVLADVLVLFLEQIDCGVELFGRQRVRVLIPRSGFVLDRYSAASAM
jgi:hypothetical protein